MNDINNISSPMIPTGIYTDFSSLAELRAKAATATGAQKTQVTRQVAKQFEALFLQMMLKSMRNASPATASDGNQQTRFYQGMFDKQIALDLSNRASGGIGLAAMMERQLATNANSRAKNNVPLKPLSFYVTTMGQRNTTQPFVQRVKSAQSVQRDETISPQAQAQFIQSLWPHANQAAAKIGVKPEVLIAQSALETGWGQKMVTDITGTSANNLFGIKADSRWQGKRAFISTLEYRDGIAKKERASFRAYGSIKDSFDDYARLLKNSPRYQSAIDHAGNTTVFLQKLQQAGYSTDPVYAEKIQAITQRDTFLRTVMALKNNQPLNRVNWGAAHTVRTTGGNQ